MISIFQLGRSLRPGSRLHPTAAQAAADASAAAPFFLTDHDETLLNSPNHVYSVSELEYRYIARMI